MGERAGYRCRQGEEVSPIFRKQWFIGDGDEELKGFVTAVAGKLMETTRFDGSEPCIADGDVALRDDLWIGRLFPAMLSVLYDPPFDSVETTTNCDISDHGLFEIELWRWNLWSLNHYDVGFMTGELGEKEILFGVEFVRGKPLKRGVRWLTRERLLAKALKE